MSRKAIEQQQEMTRLRGSARRREILDLLVNEGLSQAEVARRLNISQAAVSKHRARIEADLRADNTELAEIRRQGQMLRNSHVRREAMAGWERSFGQVVRTTVVEKLSPLGGTDGKTEVVTERTTTTVTEHQAGNPAFLARATDCERREAELFGLDEPKRTDVTSGGEPMQLVQGIDLDLV